LRGKDAVEGLPKIVVHYDSEVRDALAAPLRTIEETVLYALEHTPPELSADIIDRGIMLTGGGAMIRRLDKLLSAETGIPVRVAERPLLSVAEGTAKILGDAYLLRRLT
jgi:rod shape-determining protein MreB